MVNAVTNMADHPVRVALEAVSDALDTVVEAALWALSDEELEWAIGECQRVATRQEEFGLQLVREADDRDLGRRMGASSTVAWLRHRFRMRPGAAKSHISLAHRLRSDGAAVDWSANVAAGPQKGAMPATGALLAAGEVSIDHAQVIAKVMSRLPDHVDTEQAMNAEADLAKWAKKFDPASLARLGEHLLHVLDADTLEEDEERQVAHRELRLNEHTGRISGRLDNEGMAMLRTALDPLAAPCPAAEGTTDPRSPARRNADALIELARRACDTGTTLPTRRGARPHLTITATIDTLQHHTHNNHNHTNHTNHNHSSGGNANSGGSDSGGSGSCGSGTGGNANGGSGGSASCGNASCANGGSGGSYGTGGVPEGAQTTGGGTGGGVPAAELHWGGALSAEALRRIACDAAITRVITDPASVPLDVGREHRTVTPGQYAALVVRDGGCAFPGCTRPPAWTEAHHIRHWADGGATTVDNTVLLCGHHHRSVHHRGWDVHLDHHSQPEFIPPPWIDPTRTPQRNDRPRYSSGPRSP